MRHHLIHLSLVLTLLLGHPPSSLQAATRSSSKSSSKTSATTQKIPSAAGKPNVLLILVDDLNDWVGWLGGHPQTRTPHMDRLARMGIRFTNAHSPYPLCNPARTALLTGLAPWNTGLTGNEQDWRHTHTTQDRLTLPQSYRLSGYKTAAGGKVFHANHGGPQGRLTGWHGGRRGFEQDSAWDIRFPQPGIQLPDPPIHTGQNYNGLNIWHWDWGTIPVTEEQTEDAQTIAWATHFLSTTTPTSLKKQPFFLTVGIYRPHTPWYLPQSYFDPFPLDQIQLPPGYQETDLHDLPPIATLSTQLHQQILAKDLWKKAIQAYLASITFADTQVGKLLTALEQSPAAKNTIICLTSDHGYQLGEKHQWHKGKLWERTTHIPLTLTVPSLTQPDTVSHQPVSLLDIYPTLHSLTRTHPPDQLDGTSLLPLLTQPDQPRTTPAISTSGTPQQPHFSARTQHWRYTQYADGSQELYDHRTDPHEWTNLATQPQHTQVKSELAAHLPTHWASPHRPISSIQQLRSPQQHAIRLQNADHIPPTELPSIVGKTLDIEAAFDYQPSIDSDSTLLSHGDQQHGWALHLVEGRPTLTLLVKGQPTTLMSAPLSPGPIVLRAQISNQGLLALNVHGQGEIIDRSPHPTGFPQQPPGPLTVGESFGILDAKTYPNSTPLDTKLHRLWLTLLP